MNDKTLALDPSDILKIRERNGAQSWWISQDALTRNLNGLTDTYLDMRQRPLYLESVSPAKQRKEILPDTGRAWRWARINGRHYYAYENIPNVAPAFYKSRLPRPENLENLIKEAAKSDRLKSLETMVKEGLEALEIEYRRHYYGYESQQMNALARACAALQTAIDLGEESGYNGPWLRDFGAVLDRLQVRYLPNNWRRLKDKIDAVRAGSEVWQVVDLPRRDNQNARKLDDSEVESWIVQMRGMPQNFTSAHIIRKVRQMCELTGKRLPSESWIAATLAAPAVQFLTSAGRYGERGRLGNVYREYTPVANAIFADDAWQLDGTRVNFIPWKNDQGREEFLYMVVCRDVHSGAILGASFGLSEDRWMYVNALSMAARMTNSLPYEVSVDRFPGHNTPEWQMIQGRMEALGVRVSYKHTATGKAQLERWFGTLQSVFFQESPYYYGEGIQSRRAAAHRSAEYLKAVRKVATKQGWNMDTATREALACIGRYNDTPLAEYSRKHATIQHSPTQLYQVSEKPHCHAVAAQDRAMLFGLMKRVTIRNSMIRTEIQRGEYHYAVNDYETIKNHRTVLLAYDLEDLSTAWVFEDDEKRLLNPRCLCEAPLLERVQVFGPQADYKALGRDTRRRGETENKRTAELENIRQQGSEVTLLLNGLAPKSEAETAETAWLEEQTQALKTIPALNAAPEENEDTEHPEIDGDDIARMVLAQM